MFSLFTSSFNSCLRSSGALIKAKLVSHGCFGIRNLSTPITTSVARIRQLKREEIPQIKKMTDDVGWDYAIDLVQNGYDCQPEGWFCAVNDRDEVVGSITITLLDRSHCAVANFIILKDYRGRGIAKSLIAVSEKYGCERSAHFFSTAERRIMYRHLFKNLGEYPYTVDIHGGKMSSVTIPTKPNSVAIRTATDDDLEKIIEYDNTIHIIPRPFFVKTWICHKDAFTVVSCNEENGFVVGVGAIRPCAVGWEISPLYADNHDIASAIFYKLSSQIPPNSNLKISIMSTNVEMRKLAENVGLSCKSHLYPMFTTKALNLPTKRIFSLATISAGLC